MSINVVVSIFLHVPFLVKTKVKIIKAYFDSCHRPLKSEKTTKVSSLSLDAICGHLTFSRRWRFCYTKDLFSYHDQHEYNIYLYLLRSILQFSSHINHVHQRRCIHLPSCAIFSQNESNNNKSILRFMSPYYTLFHARPLKSEKTTKVCRFVK